MWIYGFMFIPKIDAKRREAIYSAYTDRTDDPTLTLFEEDAWLYLTPRTMLYAT